MTTTIQISNEVKEELSSIKQGKSYDDVLKDLLKKHKRMIIAEKMTEYGKKYANEGLKEVKEWESTEKDLL